MLICEWLQYPCNRTVAGVVETAHPDCEIVLTTTAVPRERCGAVALADLFRLRVSCRSKSNTLTRPKPEGLRISAPCNFPHRSPVKLTALAAVARFVFPPTSSCFSRAMAPPRDSGVDAAALTVVMQNVTIDRRTAAQVRRAWNTVIDSAICSGRVQHLGCRSYEQLLLPWLQKHVQKFGHSMSSLQLHFPKLHSVGTATVSFLPCQQLRELVITGHVPSWWKDDSRASKLVLRAVEVMQWPRLLAAISSFTRLQHLHLYVVGRSVVSTAQLQG